MLVHDLVCSYVSCIILCQEIASSTFLIVSYVCPVSFCMFAIIHVVLQEFVYHAVLPVYSYMFNSSPLLPYTLIHASAALIMHSHYVFLHVRTSSWAYVFVWVPIAFACLTVCKLQTSYCCKNIS